MAEEKNPSQLINLGQQSLRLGDYKAGLKYFNQALGLPSGGRYKGPSTKMDNFTGITEKKEAAFYASACQGAWYACIRLAESGGKGSEELLANAMAYAELRKSPELLETLQMSRIPLDKRYLSGIIAAEQDAIAQLEGLTLEKDGGGNLQDLFQARQQIIHEVGKERENIYYSWILDEDPFATYPKLHSVFEEYDLWNSLTDICATGRYDVGILYFLVHPMTQELVTISYLSYFYPADGKAVRENQLVHHRVKFISPGQLEKIKQSYQDTLLTRDPDDLKALIVELDRWLIPEELSPALQASNLLIVPDECLEWVPWELVGASKNLPFGIHYGLTKVPGIDLFRVLMNRGTRNEDIQFIRKSERVGVLFSNPLLDLPGTEEEVKGIDQLLKEAGVKRIIYHGEQAIVDRVRNLDLLADIVHFACHAKFCPEDPMLSRLLFSDGFVTPRMIEALGFDKYPLVILSACESGAHELLGGEVLGFVRCLFSSGASSFIVTNWKIDDDSSKELMLAFYRGYLAGKPVALALKDARQQLFEKAGSTPFDWGAYTLYGDPFRKFDPSRKKSTEELEVMIWELLQSIGGPDEGLAWKAVNALEDMIVKNAKLVRKVILEGFTVPYDDWEPGLIMPKLLWFAEQGYLDREYILGILRKAKKELEEGEDPLNHLWLIEPLLDPDYRTETRAQFNPAINIILPYFERGSFSDAIMIYPEDEKKIGRILRALESESTMIRRAASDALSSILSFCEEFPQKGTIFYRTLSRAMGDPDPKVNTLLIKGLVDVASRYDLTEIMGAFDLIGQDLSHPQKSVRQAATKAIKEIFEKEIFPNLFGGNGQSDETNEGLSQLLSLPNEPLQTLIVEGIGQLCEFEEEPEVILNYCLPTLTTPNGELRLPLVFTLARILISIYQHASDRMAIGKKLVSWIKTVDHPVHTVLLGALRSTPDINPEVLHILAE